MIKKNTIKIVLVGLLLLGISFAAGYFFPKKQIKLTIPPPPENFKDSITPQPYVVMAGIKGTIKQVFKEEKAVIIVATASIGEEELKIFFRNELELIDVIQVGKNGLPRYDYKDFEFNDLQPGDNIKVVYQLNSDKTFEGLKITRFAPEMSKEFEELIPPYY